MTQNNNINRESLSFTSFIYNKSLSLRKMRKYIYSIPMFVISIGFIFLTPLHWFAFVGTMVAFWFGIINYQDEVRLEESGERKDG